MYDIITFGSATQDIVVKPKMLSVLKYNKEAPRPEEPGSRSQSDLGICFPLGSKIDVDEINFFSGGGGTNTAATFALQGLKTAFCGMVGEDLAAKEIITELKKLGVDTGFVFKTNKKPTNHSIVILDNRKEKTILTYRGASELMDKNNIPWKKLKTQWIYLAPLTGLLCDTFEEIINFAVKNKVKVAVNPSMAQLSLGNFPEITKKIDILFLNQEEASFLTKTRALNLLSARPSTNAGALVPKVEVNMDIFKKIDDIYNGVFIMTMGGEGVVVSDGKNIYRAKPVEDRKIVDTTGAGDSFASGFLSEYVRENGDIEKSIQFGLANSAGCLSKIGAKNGLLKKNQEFEKVAVKKETI